MRITLTILAIVAVTTTVAIAQEDAPAEEARPAVAEDRVDQGLLALYRFDNVMGDRLIPDLTQDIGGLDLIIQGALVGVPVETIAVRDDGIRFGAAEEMQIPGVFSTEPATELVESIRASGQLTLEAWVTPAADNLTGPARIVTISRDSAARNMTLGQHNDTYTLRLRTAATNQQGSPDLHTPADTLIPGELQHVVATFDGQVVTIYLDGEPILEEDDRAGDLTNWDETMHLVVGNEADGDRRWFGSVHLVALYGHALSADQVRANFDAGL